MWNCEALPDFSELYITGANATVIVSPEAFDNLPLSGGVLQPDARVFVTDLEGNPLGTNPVELNNNNESVSGVAVWGMDSLSESSFGALDGGEFLVYLQNGETIYQLSDDDIEFIYSVDALIALGDTTVFEVVCEPPIDTTNQVNQWVQNEEPEGVKTLFWLVLAVVSYIYFEGKKK